MARQESHADKARTALAYAMNEDFSRVLSKQMDYFSQGGGQDKVDKVKAEMDDVKNVMVDNIEKVLKRGEKIELLVDKTDNLNQQSIRFKKHSTQLKQAMWCVYIYHTYDVVRCLVWACMHTRHTHCRRATHKRTRIANTHEQTHIHIHAQIHMRTT